MKVTLHMAMTANGYIASSEDETPWSFEEWVNYCEAVVKAGNVIIGRKTYELMRMANELAKIGDQTIVVLTTRLPKEEGNVIFVNSPEKAIETLRDRGFEEAVVAGGAECNTSFMKYGLVDEIYLNVEPFLFGKGVPLFHPAVFKNNIKLLNLKSLNKNTVQLHYLVTKE